MTPAACQKLIKLFGKARNRNSILKMVSKVYNHWNALKLNSAEQTKSEKWQLGTY